MGISIEVQNSPPAVTESMPVAACDADRTEDLGLPFATLVFASLLAGSVHFVGDSQSVVHPLTHHDAPGDMLLCNCLALTFD